MRSPGSPAQPGSGVCALLPAREGKESGQEGSGRLPEVQVEEERAGQLPADGRHSYLSIDAIQLPRLGRLRLKERGYLPVEGVHILSATVSERAGRWFVSVQVEKEIPDPQASYHQVVGVDLGILALVTISDGTRIENPHALKQDLRKIKRLQRVVSRRQKGQCQPEESRSATGQAHLRVANVRKNALHQVTSLLARTKSAVVLEDLNVSGMVQNHHWRKRSQMLAFTNSGGRWNTRAGGMAVRSSWLPGSTRPRSAVRSVGTSRGRWT